MDQFYSVELRTLSYFFNLRFITNSLEDRLVVLVDCDIQFELLYYYSPNSNVLIRKSTSFFYNLR